MSSKFQCKTNVFDHGELEEMSFYGFSIYDQPEMCVETGDL